MLADIVLLTPAVPTLLLGDGHWAREIERWLSMGAAGIITLHDSPAVLFQGIREVADGAYPWVSPHAAICLAKRHQDPLYVSGLTEREVEILRHIAEGAGNKTLCQRLFIAPGTLRNHFSTIYRKIGVKSRSQAVAWAWKHGVVQVHHDKLHERS